MTTATKLPYEGIAIYDKEPVLVSNPYTGDSVMLTPEAVAVYDTIKGCEMFGDYDGLRVGLDWFRKHYPKEYMVLLD